VEETLPVIHILAMLHAGAEGIESLRDYERKVLPILEEHGGKLLSAFTPRGHDHPECPDEIHLIEFPSDEAFQSYRSDERVAKLSEMRGACISKTVVHVSKEMVSYAR
jgi:uncharacterized protein (DUF1330 family)